MEPQFKHFEPSYIVGMPSLIHTSKMKETIPLVWNHLREYFHQISNLTIPNQCIGFEYYPDDFVKTGLFYYMPSYIVKDLSSIPKNMCGKTIEGGFHAVFTHKGSTAMISKSFEYIYHDWLINNKEYELSSNYDFEYYDNRFMGMSEESELEIWVPVKKIEA
jgi:AraC family transcriptional regulator